MDHERTIVRTGEHGLYEDTTRLSEETLPMEGDDKGPAPRLPRGATVDRYVIVDELGAGGMGVVYAAYDPELDRRLAIKVLLPSFVGPGRPRLVREAQAIARIAHPNVVAVHDVGQIDGSVFVAMELVDGTTLGRWVQDDAPSIPEILRVFTQAGRGLAAAHAADLIHRDFKPDNVLLGHDGRVRVVDFGLARGRGSADSIGSLDGLSHSSLDEALTEAGSVMGTPAYMAPEQIGGRLATASSDQFSFCVALYEALYGERPFAGKTIESLSVAVHSGQIREPPPGRRVPAWLRRVLLRGLQSKATERYPTMDALLVALARDPAARRRRWVVGGVLGLGALGMAAMAYRSGTTAERSPCASAADEVRAVWNRDRRRAIGKAFGETNLPHAADTWSRVHEHLDTYASGWAAQATEACEATHVDETQPAELLERRRHCLGQRLERLDAFLAILDHPEAPVVDRAVRGVRGLPDLEGCRDVQALEAGVAPPENEATRREVEQIREQVAKAEAMSSAAKYREEAELLHGVLEQARATSYLPVIASVEHQLARALRSTNDDAGVPMLKLAFRDALAAGDDRRAAMAAIDIAHEFGYEQRLHERGREWIEIANALIIRQGGAPKLEIGMLNAQAIIAVRQAKYDEAQALFEQLVGKQRAVDPDDPNLAVGLMNLGGVHAERRSFDDARRYMQQALEITERVLGPKHPSMTSLYANLSLIAVLQGHYEEAKVALAQTLELQGEVLGDDHPDYARTLVSMAVAERNLGDPAESERLHRLALSIRRRKLGDDHPEVAESLRNLAWAVADQGRVDDALELARDAQQTAQRRLEEGHPDRGHAAGLLAWLLALQGSYREALEQSERALEIYAIRGGVVDNSVSVRRIKGWAQRGLGRYDASIATLDEALQAAVAQGAKMGHRGSLRFELAASLTEAGRDLHRVPGLIEDARANFAEASAGFDLDTKRFEAWVREHPPTALPSPG